MPDTRKLTLPTNSTAITCSALDRRAATAALHIWREAAQWLVERGTPVWDPAIFDERFIAAARTRGSIIGAALERGMAGVALLQWSDEVWWPDRPPYGAAYIHKVAVTRAAAGRGVADALVRECERRARRRGIDVVRLDTLADRPALRALYERLGFTPIDVRRVGSFVGVRYEKHV